MKIKIFITALLVVNAGLLAMLLFRGNTPSTPSVSAGDQPEIAMAPDGADQSGQNEAPVQDSEETGSYADATAGEALEQPPSPGYNEPQSSVKKSAPPSAPSTRENKDSSQAHPSSPPESPFPSKVGEPAAGEEIKSDRTWDDPPGKYEPRRDPPPADFILPVGTSVIVRTTHALNSRDFRSGDTFYCEVDEDILVEDHIVVPRGTRALGFFNTIKKAGKVEGIEMVVFSITELIPESGESIRINTSTMTLQGEKSTKKDAAKVGGGAAIGAIIGGIAKGKKGAAAGAATGGAAGAGLVLATRGKAILIEQDSRFEFNLEDPVTLPANR